MGIYDDMGKMLTENNNLQEITSFMNNKYIVSRNDYIVDLASKVTTPAAKQTKGLRAQYFNNKDLSGGAELIRNDSRIDFNWHQNSPAVGINKDLFQSAGPEPSSLCTVKNTPLSPPRMMASASGSEAG